MATTNGTVRLAAMSDIHVSKTGQGALSSMFAQVSERADLLVMCGDLTDYGLPEEARVLARDIGTALRVPCVTVLGNHDFEAGKQDEVRQILTDAGVTVLDGDSCELQGVGFAGVKGFCGGFGRGALGPLTLKPDHAKLAAYFNIDNGTGAIRGVYLQGNDAVAPIFREWIEPFRSLGMAYLTIRNTGGTDHQSYDRVGLPGFQFIQDDIEYDTMTHHTNLDSYERLQPGDMMKNATIAAAFAYLAANRDDLFPRKPLPPPPAQRGGRGQ